MYESVFYTVAPMVLVAAVAVPMALAVAVCGGVRWFAERRELAVAEAEAEGSAAVEEPASEETAE